jgi:hypothetical protein
LLDRLTFRRRQPDVLEEERGWFVRLLNGKDLLLHEPFVLGQVEGHV